VFRLDLHPLYSLIFLLTQLFSTCCLLSHRYHDECPIK